MSLDPEHLALAQLARDRARTKRFPFLGTRKLDRMSRSPLAYLRGAAPLFYEALALEPALAAGPDERGWMVGDLHLENFGAYRVGRGDEVVFDLNDFDEATIGPLRYDVLRLVTSLILGGRTMGFDGRRALELGRELAIAYATVREGEEAPAPPLPVERLVAKVRARSRLELLAARTSIVRGKRRFIRGERYADLSSSLAKKARAAFARHCHGVGATGHAFEVLDLAFRIAGTGSLGCLRVALLVRGKGGRDGAWVFDMKEESAPAVLSLERIDPRMATLPAAECVMAGMRACLPVLPKQAGTTTLDGLSMIVRRLSPQEDKLDLRRIDAPSLVPLARHLGGLVGRAHARGLTSGARKSAARTKKVRWTASAIEDLLDRAMVLAGLHEAAYLVMCRKA